MSVVAELARALLAVLVAGLAYVAASYLLLAYLDLPEEGAYRFVEDAVFVLTLPFVLGVLAVPVVRS